MSNTFTGFTPRTIQFLKDLQANNYKEWFDEHRTIYEKEVRDRMKAFCIALSPVMKSVDVDFELRPHRCISRINRDIRFSKDKSPYKSHLWLAFMQPSKAEQWTQFPGYYFEISTEGFSYGMGIFQPKRIIMDDIRDHITYRASEFQEETQKLFDRGFILNGEEYKRPLANDLGEYFQQWYHRKGIVMYKSFSVEEVLYSEGLQKQIEADFKALEWLYNFFKQSQPE